MIARSRIARLPRSVPRCLLLALAILSLLPAGGRDAVALTGSAPALTATLTPTFTPTPTASRTPTPTTTSDPASSLECPLAPASLVIDGNLAEWAGRPFIRVDRTTAETSDNLPPPAPLDLAANVYCGWQGNDLIFAGQVSDDLLKRDSAQIWLDDSVEFSIDGDNAGFVWGGPNDHQFTVDTAATVFDVGTFLVPSAMAAAQPAPGGWRVELRVPASALNAGALAPGRMIRFNSGLNDDDNGGGRDDWLAWRGESTNSNSQEFGWLALSGLVTPIPPTATPWPERMYLPLVLASTAPGESWRP